MNKYLSNNWRSFSAVILFFAALLIYSCKKDIFSTSGPDAKPDLIASETTKWLTDQKKDSVTAGIVNKLISNLQTGKSESLQKDSSLTYLVTPILNPDGAAASANRYLVLTKLKDQITDGLIYELESNSGDDGNTAGSLILNFEKNRIAGFTGTLRIYTWKNSIKETKQFVDGMMKSHSVITAKSRTSQKVIQGLKEKNADCTNWYWETYVDGVLVSSEYVGTTCGDDGGCEPVALKDSKGVMRVKINCASGGGAPGNDDEASTDLVMSSSETDYDEEDMNYINSPNGYVSNGYEPISYSYRALIYWGETTGYVHSCEMDKPIAYPVNETIIKSNGDLVTRNLSVMSYNSMWTPGTTPRTVDLTWEFYVLARYTNQRTGQTQTKSWKKVKPMTANY